MGEAAEDILNGAVCEVCGEFFHDDEPGHPRRCERCRRGARRSIACPYCPRRFASRTDLRQHISAKRRISTAHGLPADGAGRPDAGEGAAERTPRPAAAQQGIAPQQGQQS